MKIIALILIICSIGFTLGCATGVMGETVVGRSGSGMWHRTASIQTKIAYFKDACEAYGIADGTSQMSNCLQNEFQGSLNRAQAKSSAYNAANSTKTIVCQHHGNYTTCN